MNFDATWVLTRGPHATPADGLCAMEAVARLAGENHTDTPRCACPVLARYVQILNDARWSSDAARTAAFNPWLPRLARSRATHATEVARAQWLAHRSLTTWAPLAGVAAVTEAELHGVDCAAVRAAYRALLERPCRDTALRVTYANAHLANTHLSLTATHTAYATALAAVRAVDAVHAADPVASANYAASIAVALAAPGPFRDVTLRAALEELDPLLNLLASPPPVRTQRGAA